MAREIIKNGLDCSQLVDLIELVKKANSEQLQNIIELGQKRKKLLDSEEGYQVVERNTILNFG